MIGKLEYSVCLPVALRRGNVQKNALASKDAIWCCENVRLWLHPLLNNGIGAVITNGSLRARLHTSGRMLLKKAS